MRRQLRCVRYLNDGKMNGGVGLTNRGRTDAILIVFILLLVFSFTCSRCLSRTRHPDAEAPRTTHSEADVGSPPDTPREELKGTQRTVRNIRFRLWVGAPGAHKEARPGRAFAGHREAEGRWYVWGASRLPEQGGGDSAPGAHVPGQEVSA